MVSLYVALKLLNLLDSPDEIVRLRHPKDEQNTIMTVKQVKETYDLQREKVLSIEPWFCSGEYDGMLLTLKYN